MRALVINRHDRFNGLDDTEVPSPSPANDEVSIDVQFAGCRPYRCSMDYRQDAFSARPHSRLGGIGNYP